MIETSRHSLGCFCTHHSLGGRIQPPTMDEGSNCILHLSYRWWRIQLQRCGLYLLPVNLTRCSAMSVFCLINTPLDCSALRACWTPRVPAGQSQQRRQVATLAEARRRRVRLSDPGTLCGHTGQYRRVCADRIPHQQRGAGQSELSGRLTILQGPPAVINLELMDVCTL